MKQQSTITYLKDGVEKTIKLNKWNKNQVLKEVFEQYNNPLLYINKNLKIKDNIELIHFKNVTLETGGIECISDDTLCLLENCTINNPTSNTKFTIKYGTIQLVNPILNNIKKIDVGHCENFSLSIEDENKYTKNISLFALCTNIYLEGIFDFKEIELLGINIEIGSSNKPLTQILNKGSYRRYINASNQLTINNSIIENKNEFGNIIIASPQINIDNSSYINLADGKVRCSINDSDFFGNRKELITPKSLLRTNLISILKGYRHKINNQLEKEKENLLNNQDSLNQLKQEIELQKSILELLENQLSNKTEEKEKQIVKSLSKKRVTYFDKKRME